MPLFIFTRKIIRQGVQKMLVCLEIFFENFVEADEKIIGISDDSPTTHAGFAKKNIICHLLC